MDEKVCEIKHQRIDERLGVHDKRLNSHSDRLDIIEKVNSKLEERLDGLIKQLESLNLTMRWLLGLIIGGIVSFFFYAVQKGVLK